MVAKATMTPQAAAIACAENIAVLHLLHSEASSRFSTLSSPFSNPVEDYHSQRAGYTLPFDKEKSLVGILAFLAHPNDDPNTIPAVCIEENPGAKGIKVLLSVNKASADDGKQILDDLKLRFNGIFALMDQVEGMLLVNLVRVF